MYGFNQNRAFRDTRYNMLSEREDDESEAGRADGKGLRLAEQISYYDKKLLSYIVGLHNSLRGDKINLNEVGSLIDAITHMKKESEKEYMTSLLYPESSRGSKIPSPIPVPSSSFQLHSSQILATNASGNLAIMFNPFYLESVSANSTVFVNNNANLTGNASSPHFTATNFGQTIPAVYGEYRVVSASIVIKYIGRLDVVQGVIGGAVVFDNGVSQTALGAINPNLSRYGDYNLAMDAYYTQENLTLNGMRILYFPLDNTYEQYQPMGTGVNGFGMFAYVYGGVPSATAYKVDIYVNYECLPDAAFLNYMPTSTCKGSCESKEEAIRSAQQKPITPEAESRAGQGKATPMGKSFWQSLKETVGDVLPGIAAIASVVAPEFKILQPVIGAAAGLFK